MVVYIEYAFAENALFDGVLLFLALSAANADISWKKLIFSSLIGGVFAVLFPLLILPAILAYLLKFSFAFLLCFLAFGRIKTKKEWGRYALSVVFFLLFTFLFGGAMLALSQNFDGKSLPCLLVLFAFFALSIGTIFLFRLMRAKRLISRDLYDCWLFSKKETIKAKGFFDSGNQALLKGRPVCFVSPELIYQLFGNEILKGGGQVCDELKIQTMGGEKTVCA